MKYIIANWKMNINLQDISTWISDFANLTVDKKLTSHIILAPSTIYIKDLTEMCNKLSVDISVATQDLSEKRKGAYTGRVAAFQAHDYCKYSIVGHSETEPLKEDSLSKAALCLEEAITPIICFPRFDEARDYEKTDAILAWEDPTNISKNGEYREKNPEEIKRAFHEMRLALRDHTALIYGGSVNRQNVGNLVKIKGLDGVLVGNASLDPKHFLDIIEAFEEK